ncbi:LAGLIDADG family homing endonuclease [Nanoarchaeota archaeon]
MKLNNYTNLDKKYFQITKEELPDIFRIDDNKVYLKNSKAKPFLIKSPLILDEDLAKISAMILDGSIEKNLNSCIFSQKKDKSKVKEFSHIIKKQFGLNGNFSIHKNSGTPIVAYPAKAFTSFIYHCLDIHKSDESAKIPQWIWYSPISVIREYLRYAFAMEGSVYDPKKGTEVRFHSCDKTYLDELELLLKKKFGIKPKIYKYYIKNYGWKYYLYFADIKNVTKFYEQIGFALKSHQRRLKRIVENFKSKAWEITLVKVLDINRTYFSTKHVNSLFPYLSKRAIHYRLTILKDMNYLALSSKGYSFTKKGLRKANSLKKIVRISSLRTYPLENEIKIFKFIRLKESSYNSEITRELGINTSTVRDVLKRLLKKNKIILSHKDKFQRKFYKTI